MTLQHLGTPRVAPNQAAAVQAPRSTDRLFGAVTPIDSRSDRDLTVTRLLDDDVHVRRAAFVDAVSHRWIDRGGRVVVRAVIVDYPAASRDRIALGQRVAATTRARTAFVRDDGSVLYLVTRDARFDDEADQALRLEAARLGLHLAGVGTAHHEPGDDDLGEAAGRARVAADLTAALPELAPTGDIAELGGWVLLHSAEAAARRLTDISPAAEQLRRGDALQRETIETYLDAGGQVRAACEKLHIHRTTLYYRLDNMPEVVRDALADGLKRSTLHLALKLARLRESTGAL